MCEGVRVAVRSEMRDAVGLVLLDRPEKAHAYDPAHLELLEQAVVALAAQCRALVIGSTGSRAFCAGADLDAMRDADPLDALDLRSQRVFTTLARLPVVTIAAVQGPAVAGGCELALACDIRIVGPSARFSLPETALGIIPSAGGCTRLPLLVGGSVARQMILAGASLSASRAVQLGLALRESDHPLDDALALGAEIAKRDPVALRLAKQILDRAEDPGSLDAERVSEALLYTRKQARRGPAAR